MSYITDILTDPGGRKTNQDYSGFQESEPFACWVVADGLGGHRGGESASRLAVKIILSEFMRQPEMSTQSLTGYFKAAQDAILREQQIDPLLCSMRTALVLLITSPEGAMWAHVGDCRLYHFHGGRIVFQTKDHSVPQVMVDAGDIKPQEIRNHEDRNRLLRTLGHENDLRPTVERSAHPVRPGDAFLLCTDGFWEYVLETEMAVDLARAREPASWLNLMTKRLLARVGNDYDNYTAIAIFKTPGDFS